MPVYVSSGALAWHAWSWIYKNMRDLSINGLLNRSLLIKNKKILPCTFPPYENLNKKNSFFQTALSRKWPPDINDTGRNLTWRRAILVSRAVVVNIGRGARNVWPRHTWTYLTVCHVDTLQTDDIRSNFPPRVSKAQSRERSIVCDNLASSTPYSIGAVSSSNNYFRL